MPPLIRSARPDDVPALSVLARETFIATFVRGFAIPYPPADLDVFLRQSYAPGAVAAWLRAGQVWVADDEAGCLLAYAQVGENTLPHPQARPGDGELKKLYVAERAQGMGLGRTLLERSLSWLDSRGDAQAWIGVWCENHKAQRLYRRYGFETVGEYIFAVGSWPDQEHIMRRG